jgi:hypothetical protein
VWNQEENAPAMYEKRIDRYRWNGQSRIMFWAFIVILALVISGCKKDQKLEFIQGSWYYNDAHLENIVGEPEQVTTWVFYNSSFTMDSCCFYEAYYSGYYYVTDKQDNQLTLELFNMKGQIGGTVLFKDDTQTIVIKIDSEADTIKVSGDGPYTRISP